jgi:hypothetical protein
MAGKPKPVLVEPQQKRARKREIDVSALATDLKVSGGQARLVRREDVLPLPKSAPRANQRRKRATKKSTIYTNVDEIVKLERSFEAKKLLQTESVYLFLNK